MRENKGLEIANQISRFLAYNRTGGLAYRNLAQGEVWTVSEANPIGFISYGYGLSFSLTGKAKATKIVIALEPDDTYTVYVWRFCTKGEAGLGRTLETHRGIYVDMLHGLLTAIYNEYVHGIPRSKRYSAEDQFMSEYDPTSTPTGIAA